MKKDGKVPALDLTRGAPLRQLVLFAVPMLIGAVFQMLYNMVDTMVLGKFVSAQALASVGSASSTFSLFVLIGNAASNAMSILVSQAKGAGDEKRLRITVVHSLYLSVAWSLGFGLAAWFLARPMMLLLGTPEDVIQGSVVYLQITCGLMIASMLYNAAASILRAIGDSRTPLYFLILCSVLNVVLDLAFVLGLRGKISGVAGVAWATVISQMISAVLCLGYMWLRYPMLRFSREDLGVQGKIAKELFRIAGPMLLQNMSLSIGMLVITGVINSFESQVVSAFTVGSKVEQLVTVTFSQFAFSFAVYSGQNFGARQYDRIGLGLKKAVILVGSLVVVSMAVMMVFARPMASLFVQSGEHFIIRAAAEMIRVEAIFLPALGFIWLLNSCLRGMGAVTPTVISSFVELLSKIGLSILLSQLFGYLGIWYSAPIGWVLGLIPGLIYYFFSGWKRKALERDLKEQERALMDGFDR